MIKLQRKAKGQRPAYFEDPATAKLLSITMALAGEVAVLRDRLDSVEVLLAQGKPVSPSEIDAFEPSAEDRARRDAWRDRFLEQVLNAIHQEKEELAAKAGELSYEAVVTDVETN